MSICGVCGDGLSCNGGSCWCLELPHILPVGDARECLCRACTIAKAAEAIDLYLKELTPEKRRHIKSFGPPEKLIENIDYYINASGNFVFTTWYHLRRGFCCGNGCSNCGWR